MAQRKTQSTTARAAGSPKPGEILPKANVVFGLIVACGRELQFGLELVKSEEVKLRYKLAMPVMTVLLFVLNPFGLLDDITGVGVADDWVVVLVSAVLAIKIVEMLLPKELVMRIRVRLGHISASTDSASHSDENIIEGDPPRHVD